MSDLCAPTPEYETLLVLCDTIAEECVTRRQSAEKLFAESLAQKNAIAVMETRISDLRAMVEAGKISAQTPLAHLSPLNRELVPNGLSRR